MSILDSVKGKLGDKLDGFRGRDNWDDDYDDYDEWDEEYDEDDYYDSQSDDYDDGYDPNATQAPGWDRGGRGDAGTPLVSSTDIRASRGYESRRRDSSSISTPDYESSLSMYKIEPRDGIGRASNHSPEAIDAAREELDQLQRGIPVPLNSMSSNLPRSAQVKQPSTVSRRIVTITPTNYEDAAKVADAFRAGSSVVIALTAIRPDLARRLLDFSFGVVSVSEGKVEKIGERVFFLSRGGISITESEKQQLVDAGVL
ncbi:MAG: cell division protein SepF [Coriobacteriales bacterium]|jgi:FtsZ-interacting cell division protein YlmF